MKETKYKGTQTEKNLEAAFAGDLEKLREAVTTHLNNSRKALQLIFKVNQMISAE